MVKLINEESVNMLDINIKDELFIYESQKYIKKIRSEFGLKLYFGVELEFYIQYFQNSDKHSKKQLEKEMEEIDLFKIKGIDFLMSDYKIKIEKEERFNQYEIKFGIYKDIEELMIINYVKNQLTNLANFADMEIIFAPKPYIDDYGSSMQINLSNNEEIYKAELISAILCYFTKDIKKYFHSKEHDLKTRLDRRFMAPTHISYGSSHNRSTMIRIVKTEKQTRLEHRLPNSDANILQVIYAVLFSIYHGLKDENIMKKAKNKYQKIFGNAYDMQYKQEKIESGTLFLK